MFGGLGCYSGLHQRPDLDQEESGADDGDASPSSSPDDPQSAEEIPPIGIRRMTAAEYAATVSALLEAPSAGQQDRIRLEQHLDQLRELEIRLAATPPSGGDCQQPTDPGDDWPIAGAAVEYNGQGGDGAGYSDEDLRAEVLFDIINMAFACDLSRVAAVRMTTTQSHMQMGEVIGQDGALHDHSHGGSAIGLTDCVGWHVKHFARLVSLLRDTQDFDGSPLLDSTALVLVFEGRSGYDPESDSNGLPSPHSTEDMITLVGGHAGGLNASGGQHIVKPEWHPAQAVLSAMNAAGVAEENETLGEVVGRIPELF